MASTALAHTSIAKIGLVVVVTQRVVSSKERGICNADLESWLLTNRGRGIFDVSAIFA